MRNLLIRTASGIVYVALMVTAVFTPWVAVPLVVFFIITGLYELYKICNSSTFRKSFAFWLIVGLLWIVLPLSVLFLIWIPQNPAQVLGFLILIWMSDTAAYVFGSLFGKHKLAPKISPGKTWDGFLFSCVFTAGLAVGYYYIPFFQQTGLKMWQWIVMALLTEIFGLLGDLTESWFKRKAGLKDSGNIIPGHGGVLDRVDSILLATIPAYLFCLLIS